MMIQVDNIEDALNILEASRVKLIVLNSKHPQSFVYPVININKELSSLLITIPKNKIPISAQKLLLGLIKESPNNTVCLVGLEVLFDRSLSVDPLKLLKSCARDKTILISWPGEVTVNGLSYATPNHSEYRTYKQSDLTDVIFLAADTEL